MAGTTDDEALFQARTERLDVSQTEMGVTIRASTAPTGHATDDVDPSVLPRITLDTRAAAPIPLERAPRPDLAIVSTIGEGGMGRVHLARQRSLDRDVAVKTLKSDATPAVSMALLREARVTGMLEHPGVIPVHALGVDDDGRPMLVMKRVDGTDLSTRLGGEPQTGERLVAALEALMQVCRTCEFAHSRGVLHRDIKPENIMVGGFGEVYLLDWGIATKLDPGAGSKESIVGTPCYMAPEMVLGRALDARTDVYLVGATLHEVLTGKPRHGGKTMMEVARNAMSSEPFAYGPDVPAELASLCNRATARDPAKRPASAAAMREEIALFLRHRAARAIAEAALERLATLQTLLAAAELAPAEIARAYRLVAEARFGLAQSLEQDPTNEEMREALRRSSLAAIDLELRQAHVGIAEALYKELDAPDAAVETRIAEARAHQDAKAKEHERLERIDHDLDPTQHASRRTRPMLALAVILLVIGVYVSTIQKATPTTLVTVAGFSMTLILGGTAFLWRRVLTNAFNRRGSLMLVISMAFILLDRTVGLVNGRPVAETLANDSLLLALFMAAASISFVRAMWPGVVLLLIGLAGIELWPEHAPLLFTCAATCNLVVGAWALARARRI